jgi:hypothetical protein
LPIADCRLPIADCRLPIANCQFPIGADHRQLRICASQFLLRHNSMINMKISPPLTQIGNRQLALGNDID